MSEAVRCGLAPPPLAAVALATSVAAPVAPDEPPRSRPSLWRLPAAPVTVARASADPAASTRAIVQGGGALCCRCGIRCPVGRVLDPSRSARPAHGSGHALGLDQTRDNRIGIKEQTLGQIGPGGAVRIFQLSPDRE